MGSLQGSSHLWHFVKRPLVLVPAEAAILGSGNSTLAAIFLCTRPIACRESTYHGPNSYEHLHRCLYS